MYILFVDESGTPPPRGRSRPNYFVVGGVIIPEDIWHRTRDAILGMKLRRKIRGELKWRYFAPDNDQPGNPMRKEPQDVREAIREELYRIIIAPRSVRSLAAVCSISTAYKMASVDGPDDIYHLDLAAKRMMRDGDLALTMRGQIYVGRNQV